MSGAASGMVSGFAGDVLLLTGGTAAVAAGAMALAGAVGSFVGDWVESSVTGVDKSFGEMAVNATWNAGLGAMFGYIGGEISSQMTRIAEYGFAFVADRLIEQEMATFASDIGKEITNNYLSSVIRSIIEFLNLH